MCFAGLVFGDDAGRRATQPPVIVGRECTVWRYRGLKGWARFTVRARAVSIAMRTTDDVRRRVSPDMFSGPTAAGQRWTTLIRWARDFTSATASTGMTIRSRSASALRTVATKLGGLGLGPPSPADIFRAAHQIDEAILRSHGA